MRDQTSTYLLDDPGQKRSSLSPVALTLLFIATGTYFIIGQAVAPMWLVLAPVAAFAVMIYSANKESMVLSVLVLTITLVQLKDAHGVFTIYDALAGTAIILGLVFAFFRCVFVPQKYRIGSNQFNLAVIYFFWVAIVGIPNFLFRNGSVESWFRDLLLIAPLVMIPPFLATMEKKRDRNVFFVTMLIVWVICFITSIVNVRSSFLASTYLFEISYRMINGLNGPLMLLIFFNLYLFERRKGRSWLFLFGMLISIAAIVLTHNRTYWVLTPLGVGISVLLASPEQRKRAFGLLAKMTVTILVASAVAYATIPLFRVVVKLFFVYFLTSSNLKTDPSLVGRYVEWRWLSKAIAASPIAGYGAGSTYHAYDWFRGYFYEAPYTHNGYLGVLQKGGLVGFIIIFSAYLGFIKRGWTLIRRHAASLDTASQAIIRSGIIILGMMLIATNTSNWFAHRDLMMYVSLIWGYILLCDRQVKKKEGRWTESA